MDDSKNWAHYSRRFTTLYHLLPLVTGIFCVQYIEESWFWFFGGAILAAYSLIHILVAQLAVVRLTEGGMVVRNYLRRNFIPYPEIIRVSDEQWDGAMMFAAGPRKLRVVTLDRKSQTQEPITLTQAFMPRPMVERLVAEIGERKGRPLQPLQGVKRGFWILW